MALVLRRSSGVSRVNVAIALTLALSACSEKKLESTASAQVVAKVNGSDLSARQLEFGLKGLQENSLEITPAIRKATLDRLIEREVLVQDAIAKKVDRDPAYLSQLEAAQRELLVRHHLQKLVASVQSPSSEAVNKFYTEHPDLFKDRMIYQFTELVIPRVPPNWSDIEKTIRATKTIPQVLEGLRKRGINPPVSQNVVRTAEELPQENLKEFALLKDGEIVVYANPTGVTVAQIVGRRPVPLDEAQAKSSITKFLVNRSQGEVVQAEVKRLMGSAKVSYEGEFKMGAQSGARENPKVASETAGGHSGLSGIDKALGTAK
jgi:EpsD family peptidyl-prolyl cis-trans isomerase